MKVLAGIGVLGMMAALAGLLLMLGLVRSGFSARPEPGGTETRAALALRRWATPGRYDQLQNPLAATPKSLSEAAAHWADHCASCHGNDGSGDTTLGQSMYPRPPDMRGERTQMLSDGALYRIINQGIRFTAMPAWGEPGDDDKETWAVVGFIRTLPSLTREQVNAMKRLNPVSAAAIEARRRDDAFLCGKPEDSEPPESGSP